MLKEDKIHIYNDGRQFTEGDIEAICSTGWSNKDPSEFIGYLGAGFKSVFLVSNNPRIYSGPFQFEFKKDQWDDPESFPWQIVPIPIQNSSEEN